MPVAVPQPTPSRTDILDGISQAFFTTMSRDGSPRFLVLAAVLTATLLVWLLYWLRRETRRERLEQEAIGTRHEVAMSQVLASGAQRKWVSVAAHRPISVQHQGRGGRIWYEECETQSLSGDLVAFYSKVPRAPGLPLHFAVDLGEKSPLQMRGVVARVEPPAVPGGPSLLEVRLGPITDRDREHVVRWVTVEEEREIAKTRRGPLCASCGRPVADGAEGMHSTCASLISATGVHPKN
jgi:hypothetical protein